MIAVHVRCRRCGRATATEGDQGGDGFGLRNPRLDDLASNDPATKPGPLPAVTPGEALAALLRHCRRSWRRKRRR
jgi:hypothetical protein